jgi:type I restriction enzyme, R subunit
MENEAQARLKINALLQQSGWRLTEYDGGKVNVKVENHLVMGKGDDDTLGLNFEKQDGRADYLLLDYDNFPICVLEAKAEQIHPLAGKEQARAYANSLKVRYVILSNGNEHFFWDLEEGDPRSIDIFPTPESITANCEIPRNVSELVDQEITRDYLVQTQYPEYQVDPLWQGSPEKSRELIEKRNLCFLRNYQVKAVESIQEAMKQGNRRFLFEMATGTGKTATSAAVIRMFIKSRNARRVLFLVDRLELEDQAAKAFRRLLKPDITTVVYKERRNDWQGAEVVVTTIQSIMNKYGSEFFPTDFDLIISDEAHRLIAGEGSSRNVFDYFVGYKLGLTATPKDFLRNFNQGDLAATDPRELERRRKNSTYHIFGCNSGEPTFSYTLKDGVKEGYLVNPVLVDCRTQVTTQLLSDEGFVTEVKLDGSDEMVEGQFTFRDFEKSLYSPATNLACMQTFLKEAKPDPISGEVGKTLVFCVSQNHAAKLTQMLNELATTLWPGLYQSDFAMQVTSNTTHAQTHTIQFANNVLSGTTRVIPGYKSSKTRVCVTVGMMSTGYDCEDILNICLMRPIFSPSEFIQIKGRGTRTYPFKHTKRLQNEEVVKREPKDNYKLFDFFANCEYFQEKYDYKAKPKAPPLTKPIPAPTGGGVIVDPPPQIDGKATYIGDDVTILVQNSFLSNQGMRIDQELAKAAAEKLKAESAEKDRAKEAFTKYLSQQPGIEDKAELLWPFFMVCWFNPAFQEAMKKHSIIEYSGNPELFKVITDLAMPIRDDVVQYIFEQKVV